ncbi:hypothetical protein A2W24_04520 [Microgenomates group bacterium RBG_16_45_19]|nr:MAG: hypothetical protein A2W24_04520 [Microgenomates group bacterium RBG_16_45_19]
MLPIILTLGPIKIYTYAVALALALIGFFYVVWKQGREAHFEETELMDATMVVGLVAAVGARVAYIGLVNFAYFGWRWTWWLSLISKPGVWYLGFLVAGLAACWWQARRRRWDFLALTDVLVVAYALSQAIMAGGRWFNGSGYGIVSNTILGMRFAGMVDKHLPVQLLELLAYLATFILLWWTEGQYRTFTWYKGTKSEAQSGFVTAVYLILFGLVELMFTPLKLPMAVWWGIRIDALVAGVIVLLGIWLLYRRSAWRAARLYQGWQTQRQIQELKPPTDGQEAGKINQPTTTRRWGKDIFD